MELDNVDNVDNVDNANNVDNVDNVDRELFTKIPIEIGTHICSFLTLNDLLTFAKCSKSCFQIVEYDELYKLYVKTHYSLIETYPMTFHNIQLTKRLYWQDPKKFAQIGYFKFACEKQFFDVACWMVTGTEIRLNGRYLWDGRADEDVNFLICAIEYNTCDNFFKKWINVALDRIFVCERVDIERFYLNTAKKCCKVGTVKTLKYVLDTKYADKFVLYKLCELFYEACLKGNFEVVKVLNEKYPQFELWYGIEYDHKDVPAIALLNSKNAMLIKWTIQQHLTDDITNKADLIMKNAIYHKFYDAIESFLKYYPHDRKLIKTYLLNAIIECDIMLMRTIVKNCPEIDDTYLFEDRKYFECEQIKILLFYGHIDCIKLLYQIIPKYFHQFVSDESLLVCLCKYAGLDSLDYVEWIFLIRPKINIQSIIETPKFGKRITEHFLMACKNGNIRFAKWLFIKFSNHINFFRISNHLRDIPKTVLPWLGEVAKYCNVNVYVY